MRRHPSDLGFDPDREREFREFEQFRAYSRNVRCRSPRDADRYRDFSPRRDRRHEDRYAGDDDRRDRRRRSHSRSRSRDRYSYSHANSRSYDRSPSPRRSSRDVWSSRSREHDPRVQPSASCARRPETPPPEASRSQDQTIRALADALLPPPRSLSLTAPQMQLACTPLEASSTVIAPGPAFASGQSFAPLGVPTSSPSSNTFTCNNAAGDSEWVEGEFECDDWMPGLLSRSLTSPVLVEPTDIPLPPPPRIALAIHHR